MAKWPSRPSSPVGTRRREETGWRKVTSVGISSAPIMRHPEDPRHAERHRGPRDTRSTNVSPDDPRSSAADDSGISEEGGNQAGPSGRASVHANRIGASMRFALPKVGVGFLNSPERDTTLIVAFPSSVERSSAWFLQNRTPAGLQLLDTWVASIRGTSSLARPR